MKFFVAALMCLGVAAAYPSGWGHGHWGGAPIGHDGRVVDTPEVAHAKAAHFAAKAAATHGAWSNDGSWDGAWGNGAWDNGAWNNGWGYGHGWAGAPAHVALTADAQYLRDTPAVSHAKASHAVAHASAAHRGWNNGWDNSGAYTGYGHGYPHHW